MTGRASTRLAWGLCALILALLAASLALTLLGALAPPRGSTPWREQAVSLAGVVGAPVLGGLIAARRPGNPYGWLWLGFGVGLALQQLAGTYATYAGAVESGALLFAPQTTHRLLAAGGPLALALAPFLLVLFPTGRLPSRRWRPVAWVSALSGAALVALNVAYLRPDDEGGVVFAVTVSVASAIFLSILLSAVSLLFRYQRAGGVERQQLKWVALAAGGIGIYTVFGGLFGYERLLSDGAWTALDAATNTCLYAAVGVAILKYRLYDIDVVINRTLVYGSLTAALATIYFGGVAAIQAVSGALSGRDDPPQVAIVASTLLIAALFNPLRRRLQGLIDRRFYRRKYDARETLERLAAMLRNETDLNALSEALTGVVAETVEPSRVSLWLRLPALARQRSQEPPE